MAFSIAEHEVNHHAAGGGTRPNSLLPELLALRAAACLGVVLIHAITVVRYDPFAPITHRWTDQALDATQMLLIFSTPTFVFLSAVVLGYSYTGGAPAGFLWKRMRFILLPFMVMAISFALLDSSASLQEQRDMQLFLVTFGKTAVRYLAGENHLWFILPIFQFYILYALWGERLVRASPQLAIPIALAISLIYFGFFNLTEPPNVPYASLVWGHWYAIPFVGWTFYFVAGVLVGRQYDQFIRRLHRFRGWIFGGLPLVAGLLLAIHFSGWINTVSSRRMDVVLYTPMVIAAVLLVARRITMPPWMIIVSQASFGIYLLHPLFHDLLWSWIGRNGSGLLLFTVGILWIAGTMGACAATWLLTGTRLGTLAVGKRGLGYGSGELSGPPVIALDPKRPLVGTEAS